MSVPKFNEFMMPLLEYLTHGKEISIADAINYTTNEFNLSEEEQKELLPSRTQTILYNRVVWALTYLKKSNLIEQPKRGIYIITDFGKLEFKKFKAENINLLTSKILRERYESFKEFTRVKDKVPNVSKFKSTGAMLPENQTPQENLEKACLEMKSHLKTDLLDKILLCNPFFFEKLVIDLLINLGYGGSKQEAGKAFQGTKDGGIDGTIYEDKLGLDLIHIQAKRWKKDSPVGRPEIQKFAGALQGKRVKKGIFIITSYFSKEAHEYVTNLDSKIILIDGDLLTEHMFESGTGVSTDSTYQVKKINEDYFDDVALNLNVDVVQEDIEEQKKIS